MFFFGIILGSLATLAVTVGLVWVLWGFRDEIADVLNKLNA